MPLPFPTLRPNFLTPKSARRKHISAIWFSVANPTHKTLIPLLRVATIFDETAWKESIAKAGRKASLS